MATGAAGYVVVPLGWERDVLDGSVTYKSPDMKTLRNREELLVHLTSDGTCKCGLRCPFQLEDQFSFDPLVLSLPDNGVPSSAQASCKVTHSLLHSLTRTSRTARPAAVTQPRKTKSRSSRSGRSRRAGSEVERGATTLLVKPLGTQTVSSIGWDPSLKIQQQTKGGDKQRGGAKKPPEGVAKRKSSKSATNQNVSSNQAEVSVRSLLSSPTSSTHLQLGALKPDVSSQRPSIEKTTVLKMTATPQPQDTQTEAENEKENSPKLSAVPAGSCSTDPAEEECQSEETDAKCEKAQGECWDLTVSIKLGEQSEKDGVKSAVESQSTSSLDPNLQEWESGSQCTGNREMETQQSGSEDVSWRSETAHRATSASGGSEVVGSDQPPSLPSSTESLSHSESNRSTELTPHQSHTFPTTSELHAAEASPPPAHNSPSLIPTPPSPTDKSHTPSLAPRSDQHLSHTDPSLALPSSQPPLEAISGANSGASPLQNGVSFSSSSYPPNTSEPGEEAAVISSGRDLSSQQGLSSLTIPVTNCSPQSARACCTVGSVNTSGKENRGSRLLSVVESVAVEAVTVRHVREALAVKQNGHGHLGEVVGVVETPGVAVKTLVPHRPVELLEENGDYPDWTLAPNSDSSVLNLSLPTDTPATAMDTNDDTISPAVSDLSSLTPDSTHLGEGSAHLGSNPSKSLCLASSPISSPVAVAPPPPSLPHRQCWTPQRGEIAIRECRVSLRPLGRGWGAGKRGLVEGEPTQRERERDGMESQSAVEVAMAEDAPALKRLKFSVEEERSSEIGTLDSGPFDDAQPTDQCEPESLVLPDPEIVQPKLPSLESCAEVESLTNLEIVQRKVPSLESCAEIESSPNPEIAQPKSPSLDSCAEVESYTNLEIVQPKVPSLESCAEIESSPNPEIVQPKVPSLEISSTNPEIVQPKVPSLESCTEIESSPNPEIVQPKVPSLDSCAEIESSPNPEIVQPEFPSLESCAEIKSSTDPEIVQPKVPSLESCAEIESSPNPEIVQPKVPSLESCAEIESSTDPEIVQPKVPSLESCAEIESSTDPEIVQPKVPSLEISSTNPEIAQPKSPSLESCADVESSTDPEIVQPKVSNLESCADVESSTNLEIAQPKSPSLESCADVESSTDPEIVQPKVSSLESCTEVESFTQTNLESPASASEEVRETEGGLAEPTSTLSAGTLTSDAAVFMAEPVGEELNRVSDVVDESDQVKDEAQSRAELDLLEDCISIAIENLDEDLLVSPVIKPLTRVEEADMHTEEKEDRELEVELHTWAHQENRSVDIEGIAEESEQLELQPPKVNESPAIPRENSNVDEVGRADAGEEREEEGEEGDFGLLHMLAQVAVDSSPDLNRRTFSLPERESDRELSQSTPALEPETTTTDQAQVRGPPVVKLSQPRRTWRRKKMEAVMEPRAERGRRKLRVWRSGGRRVAGGDGEVTEGLIREGSDDNSVQGTTDEEMNAMDVGEAAKHGDSSNPEEVGGACSGVILNDIPEVGIGNVLPAEQGEKEDENINRGLVDNIPQDGDKDYSLSEKDSKIGMNDCSLSPDEAKEQTAPVSSVQSELVDSCHEEGEAASKQKLSDLAGDVCEAMTDDGGPTTQSHIVSSDTRPFESEHRLSCDNTTSDHTTVDDSSECDIIKSCDTGSESHNPVKTLSEAVGGELMEAKQRGKGGSSRRGRKRGRRKRLAERITSGFQSGVESGLSRLESSQVKLEPPVREASVGVDQGESTEPQTGSHLPITSLELCEPGTSDVPPVAVRRPPGRPAKYPRLIVSVPLSQVELVHHQLLECYSTSQFQPGDVVWAKAAQLPGWPGLVIKHSDWKRNTLKPAAQGKRWIKWYGDDTVSLVSEKSMKPLSEGLKRRMMRKTTKELQRAIKLALKAQQKKEQQVKNV